MAQGQRSRASSRKYYYEEEKFSFTLSTKQQQTILNKLSQKGIANIGQKNLCSVSVVVKL